MGECYPPKWKIHLGWGIIFCIGYISQKIAKIIQPTKSVTDIQMSLSTAMKKVFRLIWWKIQINVRTYEYENKIAWAWFWIPYYWKRFLTKKKYTMRTACHSLAVVALYYNHPHVHMYVCTHRNWYYASNTHDVRTAYTCAMCLNVVTHPSIHPFNRRYTD